MFEHNANYDQQTDLYGSQYFQLFIEQEIKRTKRSGRPFTVALLEVLAPDRDSTEASVLACSHLLRENIREWDFCARLSENIIGILLIEMDAGLAESVGERVFAALIREESPAVLSMGLGSFPADGTSREELMECALSCMQEAADTMPNSIRYRRHEHLDAQNRQMILVVDDDEKNIKIMSALLSGEGYSILTAANGEEAMTQIETYDIDLMLLDVMMPGISGFEVCQRVKSNESRRLIPIILLTALDDRESKIQGIRMGADDFISKPPSKEELLARVKSLLRVKKLNNRLASIEDVLISFAKAVEAKDRYTMGHVDRVADLSVSLGNKLGLSDRELWALRIGGALHDVGKIGIDRQILNKPGPLSEEEWQKMRDHPKIGYEICQPLKANLGEALDIIRHHHEKLDGSSYPDGLKGDEISMVARIMAVADIYDALVTDRPYRSGLTPEKAVDILKQEADEGKLDQQVVCCLVEHMKRSGHDMKKYGIAELRMPIV